MTDQTSDYGSYAKFDKNEEPLEPTDQPEEKQDTKSSLLPLLLNISSSDDLTKMSPIVDNIYISGIYPMISNPELIKKLNIGTILCAVDINVCHEDICVKKAHSKLFEYNPDLVIMYIPYEDYIYQNLWERNQHNIKFQTRPGNWSHMTDLHGMKQKYHHRYAVEIGDHYIKYGRDRKQNVLVHCMAGISRSVSLVIYYLMKKYGMTFEEAWSLVKQKRSIANPNMSFQRQLEGYQVKRERFTQKDAQKIIKSFTG